MALAADYHDMPLYSYIAHIQDVERRFGRQAAYLDLYHSVSTRQMKLEAQLEASKRNSSE